MEVQTQVARRLRADPGRLRDVLDGAGSEGDGRIGSLTERVCEAFDLRDGRGGLQRASCHQALRALEAGGHVSLPPPRPRGGAGRKPRELVHPVAAPDGVPGEVGEVRDLELVRVDTDVRRRIWNTLMAREHPRGAGPFVGRQMRYLVGSGHGWLGAVGFAASARWLAARDAWIGWDDARRCDHLHRVVGMCRFLIRPGVTCRNLASCVLGRAVRTLRQDFKERYGYRPWLLETFVDEREHTGVSLRAANWVRVGENAGRGRNDRVNAAPETRKAVYVYELEQDWRERLGLPVPGFEPLAAGEGLDARVWAANEFSGAPLGDARLSARLVRSAHHMGHSPMRAITGAAHGARALIKGHYRLIDQPADSEVTVDNILAPHRRRTVQRMQSEDTVLCVQDTTYLNFTRRSQTSGLTTIGTNQTGARARGLQLHATLALDPDGTPLGVLRADFSVPPDTPGPKAREQKKSFRWIEGLHDCAEVASHLPHTRPVCVMDREADFLDLFVQQREHAPAVDLLVRAKHNRVLAEEADAEGDRVVEHLFDKLRGPPSRGRCTVDVSRQSARAKASKQRRKPKRLARQAELTLRYERVTLPRPGDKPIALWMMHAREQCPPPNADPLEWFLLTTLPVTDVHEATRLLKWYALRWRIEDYFRILKFGCKIEELQHRTAERLQRATAIKMVVAWRIQLMLRLGREVPELPAELLFSDTELRVLAVFARSRKLPTPQHLGEAVQTLARLGRWTGRSRDPPGAQLLWHGYIQLAAMSFALELHDEYG